LLLCDNHQFPPLLALRELPRRLHDIENENFVFIDKFPKIMSKARYGLSGECFRALGKDDRNLEASVESARLPPRMLSSFRTVSCQEACPDGRRSWRSPPTASPRGRCTPPTGRHLDACCEVESKILHSSIPSFLNYISIWQLTQEFSKKLYNLWLYELQCSPGAAPFTYFVKSAGFSPAQMTLRATKRRIAIGQGEK
jgi:hypothetical protein